MKVKHIFVAFAVLALTSNLATAQDLDPTVVINKTYSGKLIEVHKPSYDMSVADSLKDFDLEPKIDMLDLPYESSNDPDQYFMNMKPAPLAPHAKNMYLKAGAGYTIHPTLDFVWSPSRSSVMKMDVYANHRSYIGDYHLFAPSASSEGATVIERAEGAGDQKNHWAGYDLKSNAGIDGRLEFRSLSAGFDVSYYGLASKDMSKKRMYDAVDAKFGISSKPRNGAHFQYDVVAAYRFAEDKIDFHNGARDYLGEHLANVDASLGQVMKWGHKIMVDVETDMAIYSSAFAQVSLVPHYVMTEGRWTLDAGLRVSTIFRPKKDQYGLFGTHGQVVYPDVTAYFSLLPDMMRAYAHIGGGNKLNTYASILDRNHHADTRYAASKAGLMDVTVERVSVALGLEGRLGSNFSYDLRGGYACYANELFDAVSVVMDDETSALQYLPGFGYSAYQKLFAQMDWLLSFDWLQFDGALQYKHVWGMKNAEGLFAPSAFTGDVNCEFNFNKRIFVGVDCDFATARKGTITGYSSNVVIPGYADLGVNLEYAVSRAFSVWARGGNLLNMTIQRNPLFAEKGVSATVGICLNL